MFVLIGFEVLLPGHLPAALGTLEYRVFEPRAAVTLDESPAFGADDMPGVGLGCLENALAACVQCKADGVDQLLVHDASCIGLIQTPDQDRIDARRPVHAEQTCLRTSVAHPPHVRTSRDPPARSQAPSCTVVPGRVHISRGGTVTCSFNWGRCASPHWTGASG